MNQNGPQTGLSATQGHDGRPDEDVDVRGGRSELEGLLAMQKALAELERDIAMVRRGGAYRIDVWLT